MRESARTIEDAVRDGDVAKAAVRFGAELDPAGHAVAIGSQLLRRPVGAVEKRPDVVARDVAVGDGDVLGGARLAERVRALEHDRVVVRRVDGGVRDAHVAARVDVESVAVGVDLQVVDGQRVDAGGEQREMPAVQDGEVAERDVAGPLQGNRLVALARPSAAQRDRLGIRGPAGGGAHAQRPIARPPPRPGRARPPLVSPRPSIRPGPTIATFSTSIAEIRLLRQWLWPKS